ETPQRLARLQDAARITIDDEGISHVRANNEHDLYFMQGWVHARDRLFQMDYNRRLASGTLAELVGIAALPTDVQLRTLGLRRSRISRRSALRAAWRFTHKISGARPPSSRTLLCRTRCSRLRTAQPRATHSMAWSARTKGCTAMTM